MKLMNIDLRNENEVEYVKKIKKMFIQNDFFKSICWWFLGLAVMFHRTIGTANFGCSCRFQPSCSQFAVEALSQLDGWKALKIILLRLLKCHPFGDWGYDPVNSYIEGKK